MNSYPDMIESSNDAKVAPYFGFIEERTVPEIEVYPFTRYNKYGYYLIKHFKNYE